MERVNERNNQPHLFASDEETVDLLPAFGSSKVRKLTTMEVQAYFNSLSPCLSPKSIKLIRGSLRAALNQGKAWGMLDRNPAVGVKLPRKRTV